MKCRYCGMDVKSQGGYLTSERGLQCLASESKKHVSLTDGIHCVYCGRETFTQGGYLSTSIGRKCTASPTGNHVLQ